MKLPKHVNEICFEQMRLLVHEHGMEQAIICLAYLCSYNMGEKYLLDTAEALLSARELYLNGSKRYTHNKENCVIYLEGSIPCPDCDSGE